MISGDQGHHINQNPIIKDSIPILRSVNEREGLEFTWSVWLNIKKIGDGISNSTSYKHIFNKGDNSNVQNATDWNGINVTGMSFPNNSPGMYLSPKKNTIVIVMNTFNNVIENVEINDRYIEILSFNISKIHMPHIDFEVECSKGTYIRALANDFGKKLNSGATLSKLIRTQIGEFSVNKSKSIEEFTNNIS